jgi:hypothetical protein
MMSLILFVPRGYVTVACICWRAFVLFFVIDSVFTITVVILLRTEAAVDSAVKLDGSGGDVS